MTEHRTPAPEFNTPPLVAMLETALYVDDLAAARRFYADVLGLPLVVEAEGRHVFFRIGAGMLLLFDAAATAKPPAPPPALQVPPHGAKGPGHACFAVAREDLAGWRARLLAAGVVIESQVTWPNGAQSLYFRDPAGNSLELAEPALWF